ncbi:MAG: hypothetical protein QOH08_1923 [Chloroflexota bacterium]|nr:hypothetical protein [Chloroflexota bacterium]
MLDQLLDPPFARTATFHANAKTVGLILAILGGIGLLFGLIGLPVALALSGVVPLLVLSLIGSLAGAALTAYGGYQMYRGDAEGKRWVIYGCVVYALGIVFGLLTGSGAGSIVSLLVLAAVYYIVVTSRFEPGASNRAT